jgi:hypothetical protein
VVIQRLRLAAHLALFVRAVLPTDQFSQLPPEVQDQVWEVVECYIDHLMKDPQHVPLVALYAARLPLHRRTGVFSHHMHGKPRGGTPGARTPR